jgi:hypothetical protein
MFLHILTPRSVLSARRHWMEFVLFGSRKLLRCTATMASLVSVACATYPTACTVPSARQGMGLTATPDGSIYLYGGKCGIRCSILFPFFIDIFALPFRILDHSLVPRTSAHLRLALPPTCTGRFLNHKIWLPTNHACWTCITHFNCFHPLSRCWFNANLRWF